MKSKKILLALVILCIAVSAFAQAVMETPQGFPRGATVVADAASPSGYTVHFVFDPANAHDGKTIESISVTGDFLYVDGTTSIYAEGNYYTPDQYRAGMFPTVYAPNGQPYPKGIASSYSDRKMTLNSATGLYETSFPITSGSFRYMYKVKYVGEEKALVIDDPANPSHELDNPTLSYDTVKSVVYGPFDPIKQAGSPDYSYVLPNADVPHGEFTYVAYEGLDMSGSGTKTQYLGLYLPPSYNPDRAEPYKTLYVSDGANGNELEWFCYGHADNIMDNLIASGEIEEFIVVAMDNQYFKWNFANIEKNQMEFIIPFMEARYNVSTEANGRAYMGLSMGGMTTTGIYFNYPEEFGYFGILSGANKSKFVDSNGNFVVVPADSPLRTPKVMLMAGDCDFAIRNVNPNSTSFLYDFMVEWAADQKMANISDAGLVHGGHDWFTWSQNFYHFVKEYAWK
jgi:hypothetical protein